MFSPKLPEPYDVENRDMMTFLWGTGCNFIYYWEEIHTFHQGTTSYYSNVFTFVLPLTEGRTGLAWDPGNKMMLFLPPLPKHNPIPLYVPLFAALRAKSQYASVTSRNRPHIHKFSCFSCLSKQRLRWLPRSKLLLSPADLNSSKLNPFPVKTISNFKKIYNSEVIEKIKFTF
jgi:hypothetical protein